MFILRILILFSLIMICQSIYCNDGSNPCQLDDPTNSNAYFLPENGYYCLETFNDQVLCTCPDNSTTKNKPCRLCNKSINPCGNSSLFVACTDINRSFQCLCNDGKGTLTFSPSPCDDPNISVTTSSTDVCFNEGVKDPTTNLCNCPSGFKGDLCQIRADNELCENIECMSNGVCAIRSKIHDSSISQAKCLCRMGTLGEYCEKQSIIGICSLTYCFNNGICQENIIGQSRYISCQCQPGWTGLKCELQYFSCQSSGYFTDHFLKKQGKYFWCIHYNNQFIIKQKSCPKGLQFNQEKQLCLK